MCHSCHSVRLVAQPLRVPGGPGDGRALAHQPPVQQPRIHHPLYTRMCHTDTLPSLPLSCRQQTL